MLNRRTSRTGAFSWRLRRIERDRSGSGSGSPGARRRPRNARKRLTDHFPNRAAGDRGCAPFCGVKQGQRTTGDVSRPWTAVVMVGRRISPAQSEIFSISPAACQPALPFFHVPSNLGLFVYSFSTLTPLLVPGSCLSGTLGGALFFLRLFCLFHLPGNSNQG